VDIVAEATYKITDSLPPYEIHGLAQQLRRSAVSVASNIAEGHGRVHRGDSFHHLSIARGSLAELQTQLELALRLHDSRVETAQSLANEVGRMLTTLMKRLRPGSP
jgi:four helix bundle protein